MAKEDYISTGAHLQLQKIGRSEIDTKQIIRSLAGHRDYDQIQKLDVIGLEFSILQNQALNAIQTILCRTGFKGHLPKEMYNSEGFGQVEHLVLQFSPAEYYNAFGVKRYQAKSGYSQYGGADSKQALKALRSLYNKQFIIKFDHHTWSKKKNKSVKGSTTIYSKLFYNVVEDCQEDAANRDLLKSITMVLNPIFVFQIQTFSVMKPPDYIPQIKQIEPRASRAIHTFIEFILYQSRFEHENDTMRRNEETLAYQLWMDGLVKNRKWKEIRRVIQRSLEVAKAIKFITDFTYDQGWVEFTFDYNTLVRVKKNKLKEK